MTTAEKLREAATAIVLDAVTRDKVAAAVREETKAKISPELGEEKRVENEEDDDLELSSLREARIAKLKAERRRKEQLLSCGHGNYEEIVEEEFLAVILKARLTVCHFYQTGFNRCSIVDMHLSRLAPKYVSTKFVKIDAYKTPFFSQKLRIVHLPSIVVFIDGVASHKFIGFEEMGGCDTFSTDTLARALKCHGAIEDELSEDYDE